MAILKGATEYNACKEGKTLTKVKALKAHCYQCNGFDEGAEDCKGGKTCTLYPFFAYKGRSKPLSPIKAKKSILGAKNAISMDSQRKESEGER